MTSKTSISKSCDIVALILATLTLIPAAPAFTVTTDSTRDTTTASLNLLQTPTSPGFVLLGVESSTVPRPQTPTDLVVTALNETQNISQLPTDFAMDIAPYWLFWGDHISFDDLAGSKPTFKTVLSTLQLSIATKSRVDSTLVGSTDSLVISDATALGVGVSFSIFRGKRADKTVREYDELDSMLTDLLNKSDTILSSLKDNDSIYQRIFADWRNFNRQSSRAVDSILRANVDADDRKLGESQFAKLRADSAAFAVLLEMRENDLKEGILAGKIEQLRRLREAVSNQPATREGVRLDVAFGAVVDFPGREFDEGDFQKWGGWITGGYDWKKGSLLAVLRGLGDETSDENVIYDIGTRMIWDPRPKLSGSIEAAYRSFPHRDVIKDTWRIALRIDYELAKNKSVAITFGRDFEGKKTGNLISLIQLVMGFGSERSLAIEEPES